MKFGIFGGARVGRADTLHDSHGYRDFINYVIAAEKIGFEGVFLVEHHFTGQGQLSASLNLLSYLAARTTRIRLGTGVVVLPWHNPVLLAEQVATLDVLSGGRVDLGIGRGYRKEEFDAFCVPMGDAQERFNECLDVMLKAWSSDERFTHHGKRWNYQDIMVEPAPLQRPHPPIWLAGGSPQGIAYVASQNYNLLLDQLASIDQVRERVGAYLDGLETIGQPRDATRVGIARSITVVRNDAERARRSSAAAKPSRIGAIAYRPPGTGQLSHDNPDLANDDSALLGTPAEIIDRINVLAEAGAGYLLLTNASVTPEALQQFAEEILPHVANAGARSKRRPGKRRSLTERALDVLRDALMTPPPPAAKPHAAPATHSDGKSSLRSALGRFATGVTVISAQTADHHVHCMTVNSFASLSLDPPLILWTLRSRSARYHTFSRTHAFSVSVLSETQIDIARRHAQPPASGFAERNWKAYLGGCPIVEGASAHFICKGHTEVNKGDHVILIGEITEFAEYAHPPLLFMGGKYSRDPV